MSTLTREFVEEEHRAPVRINQLSYHNRDLAKVGTIDGWYYGDSSGINNLIYITDKGDAGLELILWSCYDVAKPYNMPANFGTTLTAIATKLGNNKYLLPIFANTVFVFDPVTSSFTLDITNLDGIRYGASGSTSLRVLKRLGNMNERLWSYQHRLTDLSSQFNGLEAFFLFVYNYYLSGRLSGFDDGGAVVPTDPRFNVMGWDYSQVRRSFGGKTRYEYDSLYKILTTVGILRKYGVKRMMYWPQPPVWASSSSTTLKAITWYVNQQRYNYLAFVLDVPNEGKNNMALLCPGERVVMRGSGTRLDNNPLKLVLDGWHSGARPEKRFISDWQYDNWSFVTLKLPWVITKDNNTIWYREPTSSTDASFVMPPGIYYLNDVLDYMNNTSPVLFGGLGSVSMRLNLFAYPGVIVNSPKKKVNPSTLFGPTGFDVAYLFPTDTIVTPASFRYLLTPPSNDPLTKYNYFTPLSASEITTLLSNLSKITLEAQHGPVRNNMDYDQYVGCMLELSTAMCCEVHTLIVPWARLGDSNTKELYTSYEQLKTALNAAAANRDPLDIYSATHFIPGLDGTGIRHTGCGHPAEGSEMYSAGTYRNYKETLGRSVNRIEWIAPKVDDLLTNLLFYVAGETMTVDAVSYSLAGRAVEHTIVNAIDNPKWVMQYPNIITNKPTIDFLPYPLHENIYSPNPAKVRDPRVLSGEYLVGTVKDSWVRRALKLSATAPVPKVGYITFYTSGEELSGDFATEPWYDSLAGGGRGGASFIVAKVIRYLNEKGVQHIVVDVRNTVGGGSSFWEAFAEHSGADRPQAMKGGVSKQNHYDPTGNETYAAAGEVKRYGETVSAFQEVPSRPNYKYIDHYDEYKPSGVATVFPAVELFGGPAPTVVPGTSTKRNIVWITPSTNISATQLSYQLMKGCSLDQNRFDGDWGNNVQLIGFGCYDRPFSSGGGYDSYINWYGLNRAGQEELLLPPMASIDRFEVTSGCKLINGQILSGNEFTNLEEPHIVWDMNMDVWFEDVGYTTGTTFDTSDTAYRRPWAPKRYTDVNFLQHSTWRDSILDRCIVIATDPAAPTHFFQRDGYGKVTM